MNIRRGLYHVYWFLRGIIAPGLRYSQDEYEETLREFVQKDKEWLDLGCGHSLLPSWRAEEERELVSNCKWLVGIDYDMASLREHNMLSSRLRGDITMLPFKDGSFDIMTANMVVEHLDNPLRQFREINRCLRSSGVFLFHTPNARDYGVILVKLVPDWLVERIVRILEGRHSHDVFKTYYRANTEDQVAAIAKETGFKILAVRMVNSDAIFALVPPLAFFELLWLRVLMTEPFRSWRNNMIVVLQKSETCA